MTPSGPPECVTGVWDRTGAGPTRAERGVAMGWPPAPRERIIRSLTREGALLYSSEPRR